MKNLNLSDIETVVCSYFNVPKEYIQRKKRDIEILQPRQIAHYLAKEYTKSSLKVIGQYFGKKDHATVMHSCKVISDLIDTDKEIRTFIFEISTILDKKSDEQPENKPEKTINLSELESFLESIKPKKEEINVFDTESTLIAYGKTEAVNKIFEWINGK